MSSQSCGIFSHEIFYRNSISVFQNIASFEKCLFRLRCSLDSHGRDTAVLCSLMGVCSFESSKIQHFSRFLNLVSVLLPISLSLFSSAALLKASNSTS